MTRSAAVLLAGLAALAVCGAASGLAQEAGCDRACLYAGMDAWTEAVASGDPSPLRLADGFRYTENGEEVAPGEGLWTSAEGYTDYRIRAADPQAGQVALIGAVEETGGRVSTFATRLKIENGAIAEAETVIGRSFAPSSPSMATAARPGLQTPVPEARRLSRTEMLAVANRNFDNLLRNDGSHFADDCQRIENRMPMSGNPDLDYPIAAIPGKPKPPFGAMGCREQVDARLFSTLDFVAPRRILVVDEEQQVVFGVFTLGFYGRTECYDIPDYGRTCPETLRGPISLLSAEMLGVRGGQIHEVEVVFTARAYDDGQGWDSNE